MTDKYRYTPAVRQQVEHMIRQALSVIGPKLRIAELAEDFGGVDLHYMVNDVPLQARCRFDRPHNAQNVDVTFRTTEPAMIDAGTYAPLMLFAWFWNGIAKAGRLIDPYRAHVKLDIGHYPRRPNVPLDGTWFHAVPFADLLQADAWLRSGDAHDWSTISTGGLLRVERLLRDGWQK